MPVQARSREQVECRTPEGRLLAVVEIAATGNIEGLSGETHPLVVLPLDEARRFGEQPVQLRERARYEYRLRPVPGAPRDLALLPQRGVQPSRVASADEDIGLIEPLDYCGRLPLTVVRRGNNQPLAHGCVEVRSIKLGYREHYRGMLAHIAERCAGLLLDSRAPTRLRLETLWQQDSRILAQQLEFLRHTLDSAAFGAAVEEVLRNPHRRLEHEREERDVSRPFKPGKEFARQVAVATRRVAVPASHPLHARVLSLPMRVSVQTRTEFFDTPENRFAKMVLAEFRDFLTGVEAKLRNAPGGLNRLDIARLLNDASRLRARLDAQMARGFFPDVSQPASVPLGSPVLQRKAGYRELLRFWLQFHAGAQVVWEGGADVFEAGARNVATLYEYWLFFQLETLFRQRFACEQPLHAIVVDESKVPAQLVLKRGVELKSPIAGAWAKGAGRNLRAEFHFNRKFTRKSDHKLPGSWTRGVQPDYTLSIWPAEYSREEAERNELMVHVHFDAKYRVERVRELLGDADDDAAFDAGTGSATSPQGAAKYSDLLKMHAYRDAVRRTAGAYVLYPGPPGNDTRFDGFHEVLPGLGAFAVRPDGEGRPEGIGALAAFLDEVIEHVANRTTARERVTYHVSESYEVREVPVSYGSMRLPEHDLFGPAYRALPPAEDMVLVVWYENDAQLTLAADDAGFFYVRLGRRAGALHVHPNLARTRQALLRTHKGVVAPGLIALREAGFRVYTRLQLRDELSKHAKGRGVAAWETDAGKDAEEYIYALFRSRASGFLADQPWNGDKLLSLIEAFESDARNKLVENVGRTSPYPRILPLRDVLKARG